METNDINVTPEQEPRQKISGRVWGGFVVVIIGTILLAERLGISMPDWIFSWGTLFIAIGTFVGAKHSFRRGKWLIPVFIGSILLFFRIAEIDLPTAKILWPLLIIIIGIMMMVRPKKKHQDRWQQQWRDDYNTSSSEDVLETITVFGSLKKNIISKQFKGGESICVFGGTELNMMQADIDGRVTLEVVQVFGGTKIIVPSNWQVQSEEMVSIFGGLEDKRPLPNSINENTKILVLRGTCLFGGINLKSY